MSGQDFGQGVFADHHFESQRSTLFDAIYIPSGEEHVKTLAKSGRVVHWVREAFGHLKPIAAVGEGVFHSILTQLRVINARRYQVLISSVMSLDCQASTSLPLRMIMAVIIL